ncbi:hypothetical protein [Roseicella aquatilis]|uniref:Flagellar protein FlgN n=1 Tax=Roseicella aquatilis TaxID=2527868 RepID=A0A4R4D3Z9_9PROT|nr:hypothetical protein [Roseicella aquatilis]TCZ53661.1 hypothetical protein EXY23_24340 [Roseicella aquatilis]
MDAQGLIAAMESLTAALAAETALLVAGDYAGAGRQAPAKLAAVEGFQAARAAGRLPPSPRLLRAVERLRDAGMANRAALERALAVQARVIAVVAAAARPPEHGPGGYGRSRPAVGRPVALSVRA